MSVLGWGVHNTIVIPMGEVSDPNTWFDARLYNNLELHLTNGGAGGEDNVVSEQLRGY